MEKSNAFPPRAILISLFTNTLNSQQREQLKEWASLSPENQIILDRYQDRKFISEQLQDYETIVRVIDVEVSWKKVMEKAGIITE